MRTVKALARIKKTLGRSVYAIVPCISLIIALAVPFEASAWTATPLPTLNGTSLSDWNWPALIQSGNTPANVTSTGVSNSYAAFSPTGSSYVIAHETYSGISNDNAAYLTTSNSNATSNHDAYYWTIYISQTTAQIKFIKSGSTYSLVTSDGTPLAQFNFWDYSGYKYNYADHQWGEIIFAGSTSSDASLDGIYAAHNVTYDSTWDQPVFSNIVQYGSNSSGGGTTSCSGIDIACYLATAFTGVTTELANLGNDFLTGLSVLFIPNGAYFSSDFSTFQTSLSNHLGFLLWPFTFVGSLFTAVLSPTGTCCVIGGSGTLFGHSVSGFDLSYVATNVPTLWTFVQNVVRGMTILALVFALRRKYLELTTR